MNASENRVARLTSRLNLKTAMISISGAILGIVLTVVPAVIKVSDLGNTIAQRDGTIDSLSAELETAEARLDARQETIESLRAENSSLHASLPYTVAPEDAHSVRAAATVTLAKRGDKVDLNSTMPNFDAGQSGAWSDTLSYNGTAIVLGYGISALALSSGVAQYETCAAATGYAESSTVEPHRLAEPSTCLRLGSDRFATIQVPRFDQTSVDVVITVWE
ncbi:hypothetical protein [Plantibacter sp. YIM 135249]|uniref:hypothetical protein n=1 Tax=Plantibacter sp. YIM 135249 TaxID=3423918 RepID=UPI003D358D71